jgi:hypothetical protein
MVGTSKTPPSTSRKTFSENNKKNMKNNIQSPFLSRFERRIGSLLSFILILIGSIFLLINFTFELDEKVHDMLLNVGVSFLPSGIITFLIDYYISGDRMNRLTSASEEVSIQIGHLKKHVEDLGVSTQFLQQSNTLGVEMIFADRKSALIKFQDYMNKIEKPDSNESKKNRLIIVGSSIKGLLTHLEAFEEIMKTAIIDFDCDLNILLTHPEYSRYRENQEGRSRGVILEEIFNSVLKLDEIWQSAQKESKVLVKDIHDCVKFYKGTPTCFMIVSNEKMLINPYPYEKEAYQCFCMIVREIKKENKDILNPSIFKQYFESHYEQPWRKNALDYKNFDLVGPDENKSTKHGDVFVLQDSGSFFISIVLSVTDNPEFNIKKGIPSSFLVPKQDPHSKEKRNIRSWKIDSEFEVLLLKKGEDEQSKEGWLPVIGSSESKKIKLDKDRRVGSFSYKMEGDVLNDFDKVGLFIAEKTNAIEPENDTNPFMTDKYPNTIKSRLVFWCDLNEESQKNNTENTKNPTTQ